MLWASGVSLALGPTPPSLYSYFVQTDGEVQEKNIRQNVNVVLDKKITVKATLFQK